MAGQLIRQKGFAEFSAIVRRSLALKLQIYARGRNREVTLDGCRFDLRPLPNTLMKLELLAGSYEAPERSAALRYIRPEWPVIELGGCIGVVACITNKALHDPHRHVVLEANPLVVPHLRSSRDSNRCSFKILNQALAYDCSEVTFTPLADFWGNSIDRAENTGDDVRVSATQLARIVQEETFEEFALVCDIEGQEYELVTREIETLSKATLIIMEMHPEVLGEEKVLSIISTLNKAGFRKIDQAENVVVMSRN